MKNGWYYGLVMGFLLGSVLGLITIMISELTSTPRNCPVYLESDVLN